MPSDSPSPVLVAGAGYVGQALITGLREQGIDVFALRRQPLEPSQGEIAIAADLSTPDGLEKIPDGIRSIVYLVSPDTSTDTAYQLAYLDGLQNLLACRAIANSSIKRLLFASSTAVYGQTDGSWVDENSATLPQSFSGQRLLQAEALLHRSAVPHVCVRFAGIYGPGRQRLLTSVLEQRASLGPSQALTNRIHRQDCAGFLQHLLHLPEPEPLYLGVDNEPVELAEVLRWLALATNTPPPRVSNDLSEQRRAGNKRCSNARLRASGYSLRYPSFREGYAELIESLKSVT